VGRAFTEAERWAICCDEVIRACLREPPSFEFEISDEECGNRLHAYLCVIIGMHTWANQLEGFVRETSGIEGEEIDRRKAELEEHALSEWTKERAEYEEWLREHHNEDDEHN